MLRLHLRDKYSEHRQEELGCRLIKIAFRLPDASQLEHSFHPTDATKVEKMHVFTEDDINAVVLLVPL